MAVMKTKNSNGEWVVTAAVEKASITDHLLGELKMATKSFSIDHLMSSINLSEYVGVDDDFILILGISAEKTGEVNYFAWHRGSNSANLIPHRSSPVGTNLMNGVFATVSGINVTCAYEKNIRIFMLNDDTYKYIHSFTILYAGIKEA